MHNVLKAVQLHWLGAVGHGEDPLRQDNISNTPPKYLEDADEYLNSRIQLPWANLKHMIN